MTHSVLLLSQKAVYLLDAQGGAGHPRMPLRAQGLRRAVVSDGVVVVAMDNRLLAVLSDEGAQLVGTDIAEPVESLLVLREEPLELLVGTEGAHLFRVDEDGTRRIETFDALPCRDQWHTPWGGPPAVRTLAATPDGWVYANIHVGSIMRSPDRGATWEPVTPDLHEDVHQVATCPAAPDRVVANTARAVYVSDDRGSTWHHRGRGLGERYGRSIAVHPTDPDLMLATVSDGPHGDNVHGQLFRSEDAGRHWEHVAGEFPASTYGNIDTHHVAFSADGAAWAIVGRTLYCGQERASRWWKFWEAPEPLLMLATRAGRSR